LHALTGAHDQPAAYAALSMLTSIGEKPAETGGLKGSFLEVDCLRGFGFCGFVWIGAWSFYLFQGIVSFIGYEPKALPQKATTDCKTWGAHGDAPTQIG
jgi:hypothetical protein